MLHADIGDDDTTLGILALGVRRHVNVIEKREMHDTTLIRIHGSKRNSTMLALRAGGSTMGKVDELVLATALVSLDVNDDGEMELELVAHKR